MPNTIRDLAVVDETSYPYIYEQNVSIPLRDGSGLVRCNVYRPKNSGPVPVLVTYGPYGKDISYQDFHAKSFSEVNPAHKSPHSAWETPDPAFWTSYGYAVVRADERGTGQSPGLLDTMSRGTSEAFFDVVEWAADQGWSSGKVGLLGISYYAGSQWRVAARRPRGLAAMIPWEGMSDYYRDRCRHGGILADGFIRFWWNRQVVTNQYGRPGRSEARWGPDTIEGDLGEDELRENRRDQTVDNAANRFRDDEYYASKDYDLGDIECPLLSVGNWGGILLHLRGNIEGFVHAGSRHKFLRMITGRHDLPFYYDEEVAVQRSFLDAFLRGDDRDGWTDGTADKVSLVLRKGNVGFNDARAESAYPRRAEFEWPLARTQYTKFFLTPDLELLDSSASASSTSLSSQLQSTSRSHNKVSYRALGTLASPSFVQFTTPPFSAPETEITGHVVARLCVSATADQNYATGGPTTTTTTTTTPSDLDLFVTLRHLDSEGREIFYTGTAGDPVPLTKGWLRVSLRRVDESHPRHRTYLPHREYASTDVEPVVPGETYAVDVELWPTNVVVGKGGRLVLEVASGDTQGSGIFTHEGDRGEEVFKGWNHVCFGEGLENWLVLPVIPGK